jgi:hypothetical protein
VAATGGEPPAGWQDLVEAVIEEGARQFSDDDPRIEAAFLKRLSFLSDNPRTIKRAINLYRFQQFTSWAREAAGSGSAVADPDLIAQWSIFAVRWPEVIRWLQAQPGER